MSQIQKTQSPIDGSIYVERALADLAQVTDAVTQAAQAQKAWSKVSLTQRKAICSRAVDVFESNKDKIAQELCWQMGRPIRYAGGEVDSFSERSRYLISIADEVLAPIQTSEKAGFDRYITHEPVGVVLVIAPWNYPLHTPINAVMPALLAGNSVILKHSAQTPLCAERIVEAFTEAGLPTAVLQCLHMNHEIRKWPLNLLKLAPFPLLVLCQQEWLLRKPLRVVLLMSVWNLAAKIPLISVKMQT